MTDYEANNIIAKYMENFVVHIETAWKPNYTESLDALIPVWEKLKFRPDFEVMWGSNKGKWSCNVSDWCESIQH